jgi:hypothetical protein
MNPDDSIVTAALRESAQNAGFSEPQAEFLVRFYSSLLDVIRLVSKGEPKNKFTTLD